MYTNILRYRGGRYLWYAAGLLGLSLALYLTEPRSGPPSGDTWQGYVLGTIGALLILWLNYLGIRKRRYGRSVDIESWVSAHVYLGVVLVFIVLLHSAGQLGWNIHTATFVLLVVAVASGVVGLGLYLLVPRKLAGAKQGRPVQALAEEIGKLNQACLALAAKCEPATALAVQSSIERTVIGGGWLSQLLARDRSTYLGTPPGTADEAAPARQILNQDQQAILAFVAELAPRARRTEEATALRDLVTLIARRQELLRRVRRTIRLQGFLQIWLYLHVPVSVSLIWAVIVHVLVVFLYW